MLSIFRKFRRLLDRQQQKKLFLLGVVTFGGAFLEVLGVSFMLPITTAIMDPEVIHTNGLISSICTTLNINSHRSFVLICIFALIFLFIFKSVYLLFEYNAQARFVNDNRFQTQRQLLHTLLNHNYEFFLNANSSEIMRNLNDDVISVYRLLMSMLHFFTESVVSIALVITVFLIAPEMTAMIFVMMAIIVLLIIRFIKPRLQVKGDELRKNLSLSYKWLLQSMQGIKDIKIAQREEFFEKSYYEATRKTSDSLRWQTFFNNTPRLLVEAGCVCSTLTMIAVLICHGKTPGELVPSLAAFAMAAVKLMPSANRIITASNEIAYYGPAIDKLLESLSTTSCVQTGHEPGHEKADIQNEIVMSDITYVYPGTETKILDHASLVIPAGACVGLIGKSGSGKTTTVDVLLGLLPPNSGEITCDGENVLEHYSDWLTRVGYIPQSIFMLDGTISENVAFGSEICEEKIWTALEEAQLADYIRSLPEKTDTAIGERGIRLSGGQLQRIGIARALYNDPEFIIFDEATSSLDIETEVAIMESISRLHGRKTMLIIAHRLNTIKDCDLVYRVINGKIEKV